MAMVNFFINRRWTGEPGQFANVLIPMTRTFSKQKSTMRPLATLLVLAAVTLLAACASTPESRIAAHYGVFAEFPPDVRQKIRAGQVDLGFTPEMVQLALGKPARPCTSKNDKREAETWVDHK